MPRNSVLVRLPQLRALSRPPRRAASPARSPGLSYAAPPLGKPRHPLCTGVFSSDAHVTVRTPRGSTSPQLGELTEHPVTLEMAFGMALVPSSCDLTA